MLQHQYNYNGWVCGSTFFRKASYMSTGPLPTGPAGRGQAVYVEAVYARRYNATWLAAKLENGWPFVQPNDNALSPGFYDKL